MAASTELAIKLTADASDATQGFDRIGAAAKGMADDVDAAARDADRAASRLDRVGDSADNLDDKAGKATGAMGALSAGFELVGAEKYATGLQSAAMATDFMSGVGQSLTLVLQLQSVQWLRAKAATVAHAVAQRATAAGTKAMAAAQWVLNAAMSANPLALVVIALVALAAAVVVAYKRSETFRELVQKLGRITRDVFDRMVEAVKRLIEWIGPKLRQAWDIARRAGVTAFRLWLTPYRLIFNGIRTLYGWVADRLPGAWGKARSAGVTAFRAVAGPVERARDLVRSLREWVAEKLHSAMNGLKDLMGRIGSAIYAPFQKLKDLVNDVLDLINKIKIPSGVGKLADAVGLGRAVVTPTGSLGGYAPGGLVQINVTGALDPIAVAQQIQQLLTRHGRRFGR